MLTSQHFISGYLVSIDLWDIDFFNTFSSFSSKEGKLIKPAACVSK